MDHQVGARRRLRRPLALVATTGPQQAIVAHGAYIRIDSDRAEVAFVVADEWQGYGIATIMLGQLAAAAQRHSINVFTAEVLPHNHRMIDVFQTQRLPGRAARARRGDRGRVSDVAVGGGLARVRTARAHRRRRGDAQLPEPTAVAVIGASRRRGTVGGELLHNLLSAGFTGAVYPVNRRAPSVAEGARLRLDRAMCPDASSWP